MRRRSFLAGLSCLALAGSLVGATAPAQDSPVAARMAAFAEAYNARDAEAVAGFYTPDGVLLAPRRRPVSGRAAIAAHYAAAFRSGVSNLRYEIREIRGHGPSAAVEIGELLVDQGERSIRGRYLHVWVLAEGDWLLSRDMYHVLQVR